MVPRCWFPSLLVFLLFLAYSTSVTGHARLECPPPLSKATGAKKGPCDAPDDGSIAPFPLRANALNTITWLESISHPGAPVRLALSGEVVANETSTDFATCVLLDHVPHDVLSQPTRSNAFSYHRSSITLWIPDIYCERCHLQLISVMTDRQHGVPEDTHCIYEDAVSETEINYPVCPSVYHSCAPVSINGTIPRDSIDRCNSSEIQERLEWPLTPQRDPDLYRPSVYYNRGDVGLYSEEGKLLEIGSPLNDTTCTNSLYCEFFESILEIPSDAPYTSLEGACARVPGLTPQPFSPGIISGPETTDDGETNRSTSSERRGASLLRIVVATTILIVTASL